MNRANMEVILEHPREAEFAVLQRIERYARTCYRSSEKINEDSAAKFVSRLLHTYHHEGIIEHEQVTLRIICDRAIANELVRHRVASYLQESTRYVDCGGDLTVIKPSEVQGADVEIWEEAILAAEKAYRRLRQRGVKCENARSVLPLCTRTEIVATMNLRAWRHFLKMRLSKKAHPDMRRLAHMILTILVLNLPTIFSDLTEANAGAAPKST